MMVVYALGSYTTISTYIPIIVYVYIANRGVVYVAVYTTLPSPVSFPEY